MARCFNDIKVVAELRPCVYGCEHRKALFHRWLECGEFIPPSGFRNDQRGVFVLRTFAILELEDGTVIRCAPEDIKFTDSMFDEYCFKWDGDKE